MYDQLLHAGRGSRTVPIREICSLNSAKSDRRFNAVDLHRNKANAPPAPYFRFFCNP